ncbi:MarR family transcriptional regulator [Leucobacter allii]|uniref:MarR family transcriptional regulator n=1 Tax=Leucobacter allii TaxID=2932247 RepID=A0ABY4FM96_9MICO|nr:MarR family transcriptional regulator [Leucobacter allii]UOQ57368.1 MarR family transcriptional regulator [Leucobacter allii]UOR01815.1 MarR family transcriptional regulator [Leucobacter allii]
MEQSGSFVYLIKQLEMGLRPRFIEACAEGGMTYGQYTALTVLRHRPGITSSELARRSFVRAQSMAATVDPLLEAGLVRREQDPAHARRMLLFLTPEGERTIDRLSPSVDRLEEQLLGDLDESERQLFASLLRRCRHALDGGEPRRASAA